MTNWMEQSVLQKNFRGDEKKEVFIENDGCGLFRGRQILRFEHLFRFQDDRIGKSL